MSQWENYMFGSAILDVAIGLIFAFLTVSLATGSIIEAGASITQWRSRMLLSGVRSLVNNPDLVAVLYNHALINPRNPGGASNSTSRNPAYIDSKQFAAALMDITGISAQIAAYAATAPSGSSHAPNVADLQSAVITPAAGKVIPDSQMQTLINGIVQRSLGDLGKIQMDLAAWFDNGMDRLSGVYKRWTQAISLVVAMLFAVGLNVDSIHLAKALWDQPVLADKIKTDPQIPGPQTALVELDKTLLVGWPDGQFWHKQVQQPDGAANKTAILSWDDLMLALLGWLITAFSTLFGAPFWFDALQSIARLKGSGPSSADKDAGRSAST